MDIGIPDFTEQLAEEVSRSQKEKSQVAKETKKKRDQRYYENETTEKKYNRQARDRINSKKNFILAKMSNENEEFNPFATPHSKKRTIEELSNTITRTVEHNRTNRAARLQVTKDSNAAVKEANDKTHDLNERYDRAEAEELQALKLALQYAVVNPVETPAAIQGVDSPSSSKAWSCASSHASSRTSSCAPTAAAMTTPVRHLAFEEQPHPESSIPVPPSLTPVAENHKMTASSSLKNDIHLSAKDFSKKICLAVASGDFSKNGKSVDWRTFHDLPQDICGIAQVQDCTCLLRTDGTIILQVFFKVSYLSCVIRLGLNL